MPNNIVLAKNYTALLDEVYRLASVTADLISDASMMRAGANANEILYPQIEVSGLGDYSRNSGYTDGTVNVVWKTTTFNYDRGTRIMVDTMDDQETFNIAFGMAGSTLQREKAEVLQLAHLLDRKPKALSGGQRQRVAIGRTLVAEPSVFLLDEPLSNLDAALRVQMRIEISRLHKRLGRTMIYVTHDQVEAMTLADKIVVLDAGRVAQVGKPLELYHYPADRFVAGFIGSPKMNFLPVKVTATAIDQVQVELPMPNRQQVWLPVESRDVQVGANMSLGIRPEHLLPSDIADVILEGEVQVVEQLGNETQIHIQIPSIRQNLVYRQNDVVLVEEGATFAIGLPPERCHLFREDGTACRRLHKEPGV